jgi:threonine dehydratase
MTRTTYAIEFSDILSAAERLEGVAHKTPVMSSRLINERVGAEVFFKCENFQKVGAFKFRGGWNAVSRLTEEQAQRGVCTHSSGNHAQAIALAAQKRGIPAYIVMPSTSPSVKKQAVAQYDAQIIECEPTLIARETTTETVQQQTGAHFIHPYNHPHVIAGQATAALELIQDRGPLDLMMAPIGGGGLMSGTCITTRHLCPQAMIWGAEPEGADDAARSLSAGFLIPQDNPNTVCDGLLTSMGSLTWPIIRDHVAQVVTVGDTQVIEAMRLIWTRMKIIIEPSCAVPLAALMTQEIPQTVQRVGIILSGGNIDLDRLPW